MYAALLGRVKDFYGAGFNYEIRKAGSKRKSLGE